MAPDRDATGRGAIDAVVFGGRRATTVPLVSEAEDWTGGVFVGATVGSERTAAADRPVGELRFDPFAMPPLCGYAMGDHRQHWLDVGARLTAPPRAFRVNWFRKDADGRFLWPGFGEDTRVLERVLGRLDGELDAVSSPVGLLPYRHDLDLEGVGLPGDDLRALLTVDPAAWRREVREVGELFAHVGDVPAELTGRLGRLRQRLAAFA